jgi:hypothetical protein
VFRREALCIWASRWQSGSAPGIGCRVRRVGYVLRRFPWVRRSAPLLLLVALGVTAPRFARAQLNEAQLAERRSSEEVFIKRFRGSLVSLSTSIGSGTFVLDDYSNDPYVSQEIFLRPRFWLTKNQNVQLLWLMECEYTAPNDPAGRHCNWSDLRLSYHHVDIWRDPWLQGRLMGSAQIWLPASLSSQNNHTVMNLRGSLLYLALLADKRLQLIYGFSLQKYLPTRKARGFRGEQFDETGTPLCFARSSAGTDGACGSGGPMNDNWLVVNSLGLQWFFSDKIWLSVSLAIWNYVRFSVDELGSDPEFPRTGRGDFTSGGIELGYQWRKHLVFGAGLTSRQPALTADGDWPRFPFWDFSSPANNYSRVYLTATWVY